MKQSDNYILIDPRNKTIESVAWDSELPSLYKLLNVQYVDAARLIDLARDTPAQDSVYVDDEGLLHDPQSNDWWIIPGWYPQPLVGRGMVHSINENGNERPPTGDVLWYRSQVRWVTPFKTTSGKVHWLER